MKIKAIVVLLLMFLLTSYLGAEEGAPNAQVTLRYIFIDGFDQPGSWIAKFSQFRSPTWSGLEGEFEPNSDWQIWLTSQPEVASAGEALGVRINQVQSNGEAVTDQDILPFPVLKSRKIDIQTIYGIKAKWDKPGYNTIELLPYNNNDESIVKNARIAHDNISELRITDQEYIQYEQLNPDRHYILLPPVIKELYLYVWGSMYNYKLDVVLEDFQGYEYVVPGGNINHQGWRLMKIIVPDFVKQKVSYLPRPKPLKLIKFRLTLHPEERITGAYFYFSYLHALADIYLESFFGERMENSQRYWGEEAVTFELDE